MGRAAFRGTGSRALQHHLDIPPPLSNLEPRLTAGAFRALVLGSSIPPVPLWLLTSRDGHDSLHFTPCLSLGQASKKGFGRKALQPTRKFTAATYPASSLRKHQQQQ